MDSLENMKAGDYGSILCVAKFSNSKSGVSMDDIIQEILLRLPMKSITRCKLLSKEWQDFISNNPAFCRSYLSRNHNSCSLLLGFYFSQNFPIGGDEPVRFLPTSFDGRTSRPRKRKRDNNDDDTSDIPFPLPLDQSLSFLGYPTVHLRGSSNGFLLSSLEYVVPKNYIVCNPVTNQWLALPPPNHKVTWLNHGFFSNGTHHLVVRAIQHDNKPSVFSTNLTMELFNSEFPTQWKQITSPCPFSFRLDLMFKFSPIITQSGLILCPVILKNRSFRKNQALIVFDQTKRQGCIQLLDFPLRAKLPGYRCDCLGTSNGLVHYAHYERGVLKVWKLSHSKSDDPASRMEWSLKHTVIPEITVENYPEYIKEPCSGEFLIVAFHPTNPHVLFISIGAKNFLFKVADNQKLELIYDFEEHGYTSRDGYLLFPYSYGLNGPFISL